MGIISDDTDTNLMLKVQKDDDRKAFTELYLRYNPRLKRYFSNKLFYAGYGDKSNAEDYAQEIFLKIWKNRDKYRPDSEFSRYIFRVAKNYWIDCQRKTDCLSRAVSLEQISASGTEEEIHSMLTTQKDGTEREIYSRELSEELKKLVETLPPRQREVIILSHYKGISHKQISAVMGCNIKTVSSLRNKAIKNLEKRLRNFKNKSEDFAQKIVIHRWRG